MSLLKVVIILSLFFCTHCACSSSKTATTTASSLNMRQGPSTSYTKITSIPKNTKVNLDCWKRGQKIEGSDQWVKVCFGSHSGYVADWYLDCGGNCKDTKSLPECGGSSSSTPSSTSTLTCPVDGTGQVMTSQFNEQRSGGKCHDGLDISPATGPIVAALSGTVSRADFSSSYGKIVEVSHSNGLKTRYAHLDSYSVKKGSSVKAGQKLGIMGNTGKSYGVHLHFELLKLGTPIDPCTNGLNCNSCCPKNSMVNPRC